MAGRARAARANHEVMRAALRDYEKAVEALRRRDLNSEERDRLEGQLERDVRDRLLHLRQKSESLVQAAAARVVELSPSARRQRAAFKDPGRAAAVAQWLEGANPELVLEFAREAAEKEDHAAAAGILRVASSVEDLDPQELGKILDAGDDDYEHARAELVVAQNETAGLDAAMEVAGLGTGPAALAAAHEANVLHIGDHAIHVDQETRLKAYERLDIDPAVEPSSWPDPEPGGTLVPAPMAPEPEPEAA